MNNKLMLASDFDGTLYKGGISERDRAAISDFRKCGNLFGIVTGRDVRMLKTLSNEKLKVDFVIVTNGSQIFDGNGNFISETRADACCLLDIAELFGSTGHYINCFDRYDRYIFHTAYPDGNEKYAPLTEINRINSFNMLNGDTDSESDAAELVKVINNKYGKYVNAMQNSNSIDIPPYSTDKGTGISAYADMAGIPYENIRCAGDELNDLSMISRFHGCAVRNARKEIKEAAIGVFDGIWDIIEKW